MCKSQYNDKAESGGQKRHVCAYGYDPELEEVLKKFGGWESIVSSNSDPSEELITELEMVDYRKEDLIEALEFARLPKKTQATRMAAEYICLHWNMVKEVNKSRIDSPIEPLDWAEELNQRIEEWNKRGIDVSDVKKEILDNPEKYSLCRDIVWIET